MGVARAEEAWLKDVIRRHAERTGSRPAREVLARWTVMREHFRRVTSRLMAGAPPLPEVRPQRTPAPVSRLLWDPELPAPAVASPATGA